MIDVHSLQVGDLCRWADTSDPYHQGLFVVRKVNLDYVWFEVTRGPRQKRFYNNGFQDIVLVREAMTCASTE